MNKHFNPAISEEKFAAWLDGMLPADEMMQISSIFDNDSNFQSLLGISESIDACIAEEPLMISDYMNSINLSHQQETMELPALESLPLSPIDIDFSNGIFPAFMPDHLFLGDTTQLDSNEMSDGSIHDNTFNDM